MFGDGFGQATILRTGQSSMRRCSGWKGVRHRAAPSGLTSRQGSCLRWPAAGKFRYRAFV